MRASAPSFDWQRLDSSALLGRKREPIRRFGYLPYSRLCWAASAPASFQVRRCALSLINSNWQVRLLHLEFVRNLGDRLTRLPWEQKTPRSIRGIPIASWFISWKRQLSSGGN